MSATEQDAFERGRVHEKVIEHDRRLNAINGSIDRAEQASRELVEVVHALRSEFTETANAVKNDLAVFQGKLRTWGLVASLLFGILAPTISALVVFKLTT